MADINFTVPGLGDYTDTATGTDQTLASVGDYSEQPAPVVGGRIMSSLTNHGGLAGYGGIAGQGGGLAG